MSFDPAFPIANLRPATYNPRHIDEQSLDRLRESIRLLGFVKPVVTKPDGLIVAGHQRTRVAKSLGIRHCPAFVLPIVLESDEIRFNQLHNGCEVDVAGISICVPKWEPGEWRETRDIAGKTNPQTSSAERHETLKLLTKYGPFSSAVATPDGQVIAGEIYAGCCKILGIPLRVRYVEFDQAQAVRDFLGREYGRYSYAHLPKTTWSQSLAQMSRLEGECQLKSSLYENHVIPNLKAGMRILDFGAGKMAYVRKLKKVGFDIRGVEFYFREGSELDVHQVQRDIDNLLDDLASQGRYDAVVCDSVLNSVDSIEAEHHVLTTVNALCKPGGQIYLSGRSKEKLESQAHFRQITDRRRYVEFLDGDGFTALFRQGVWHYQRFHDISEVRTIGQTFIGSHQITNGYRSTSAREKLTATSWQLVGTKAVESPNPESSIRFEFNLPLPVGSYGRADDAVKAFRSALEKY